MVHAALVTTLALLRTAAMPRADAAPAAHVSAAVTDAVTAKGQARVLVALADGAPPAASLNARQAAVSRAQAAVLATVPPTELTVTHRYDTVPGLAAIVSQKALDVLRADPGVLAIEPDEPAAHLLVSVPALHADQVASRYGITGSGVNVAILDTGVDLNDPELFVYAQQCFTRGACKPGNTDTGTNAQDDQGHGTNVASIVESDGSVYARGFAPGSSLVAVKILDSKGAGFVSDWIAGLDWIRTNLASLQVSVINMSLGTSTLYAGFCDGQQMLFSAAVAQLSRRTSRSSRRPATRVPPRWSRRPPA
jgi:subtilisin family serine protease